jgi:aminoglycoside phosphotransferase (APT) family kinase protein
MRRAERAATSYARRVVMKWRASQVTDLGDGRVLRRGGEPDREAALMALAREHGFPVPMVHEARSDGLVLQRINGPTMSRAILQRPWTAARHAATLAELHKRLHIIPLDGASLVHLDLHPENVLISPAGPVVIDWTNARAGDSAHDVALTWLILQTSGGLPGRALASLFRRYAGADVIGRGLRAAAAFRLADLNVTDAERRRVNALLA